MIDISNLILTTLLADTEFRALTGVTSTDPRVYPYYSGPALIDVARGKKAYITYALTGDPERLAAVDTPVYTLAVWADTDETMEAVKARVLALFDLSGQPDATLTAPLSGRSYHSTKMGLHWSSQENTKFFGVTIQLRFGASAV